MTRAMARWWQVLYAVWLLTSHSFPFSYVNLVKCIDEWGRTFKRHSECHLCCIHLQNQHVPCNEKNTHKKQIVIRITTNLQSNQFKLINKNKSSPCIRVNCQAAFQSKYMCQHLFCTPHQQLANTCWFFN